MLSNRQSRRQSYSCLFFCRILLTTLLLFCTLAPSWAVHQGYRTIDLRNGLASMFVLTLHQDADGFIWAGTYNGVSVLAGNNSEVLFPDRPELKELDGSCVENIQSTADGKIWFQNNSGIHLWDRHSGVTEHHHEAQGGNKFALSPKGGVVVFTTRHTLLYYNKVEKHFFPLNVEAGNYFDCRYMEIDSLSRLIIYNRDELIVYQLTENENDGTLKASLIRREVHAIGRVIFAKPSGDNFFFIDAKNRVLMADREGNNVRYCFTLTEAQQMRGRVTAIVRDGQDLLISFNTAGLTRMRHQNDDSYIEEPQSFTCGVFDILKDNRQDIVWVATDGEGICYRARMPHNIHNELYENLPIHLSKPIRALIKDINGDLWVATKGDGVICFSDYKPFEGGASGVKQYTRENSELLYNSVYCFSESTHDIIWMGTDGNGVNYYDPKTKRLGTMTVNSPDVMNIHGLLEVDGRELYIASSGHGILRIRLEWRGDVPVCADVQRVVYDPDKNLSHFIAVSREGTHLWFACRDKGFVRYDMKSEKHEVFLFDDKEPLASKNDAICVDATQKGAVYCGTSVGAFQIKSPYNTSKVDFDDISSLIERQGKVIRALVTTPDDTLWAATSSTVFCMDTKTRAYNEYTFDNGLSTMEIGEGAGYFDRQTGITYFGATNGFVAFSPRKSVSQSMMPPVIFYAVRVGTDYFDVQAHVKNNKPLKLRYNQNYLRVGYTAIDYVNANDYIFEYSINDRPWNDNANGRTISFVDLSPGEYKIQVRYRIGDAVSPVYQLRIRIMQPWWLSLPACIFYSIIGLMLIGYFIFSIEKRRRLHYQQEQDELEKKHREEIYSSRLRFFIDLTHQFSTPLMLIEGPVQRILAAKPLAGNIQHYAELISESSKQMNALIQRVIEFRSYESGHLMPMEPSISATALVLPPHPKQIDPDKHIAFVVDENHEVLSLLKDILQADFNVFCFDNAQAMLTKLAILHPHVVVAETTTQDLGGLELCRRLKADSATTHLPVVLISTDFDPQTRTESATVGADAFLTKPFDLEYFLSLVRSLVQQRSQLKAYFNSSLSAFELHDGKLLHEEDRSFMEKIVTIISENLDRQDLSAAFVADQLGVGLRNLYRRMQEISTETPTTLIRELRLERARQLLTKTEMSMEEVCFQAGYSNRGTFYKQFSAKFGCTPGQYHEQMMKKVTNPETGRENNKKL